MSPETTQSQSYSPKYHRNLCSISLLHAQAQLIMTATTTQLNFFLQLSNNILTSKITGEIQWCHFPIFHIDTTIGSDTEKKSTNSNILWLKRQKLRTEITSFWMFFLKVKHREVSQTCDIWKLWRDYSLARLGVIKRGRSGIIYLHWSEGQVQLFLYFREVVSMGEVGSNAK